jgi:hypothetical protein
VIRAYHDVHFFWLAVGDFDGFLRVISALTLPRGRIPIGFSLDTSCVTFIRPCWGIEKARNLERREVE